MQGINHNSDKRIAVFLNSSIISGAEIVLKDYIKKSHYNFSLIVTDEKKVIQFFEDIPNIDDIYIIPFPIKKRRGRVCSKILNMWSMVCQAVCLKRYVDENRISLLYANNTTAGVVAGIIKPFINKEVKLIIHIHDMMSTSSFRSLVRLLCKNIPMIAVSKECRKELLSVCCIKSDVFVAYNGLPINTSSCVNRHEGAFVIGYAGSITERKGVKYLAEAYKNISKDKNVFLEIAYNVKENEYYDEVVEILAGAKYRVNTYTRDEMSNFYNKIDLLVVPSVNDPFPTTILEAMNNHTFVIGSNVDGIPEMIDEKWLFLPKDVASLENLIRMVLSLSLKERIHICDSNYEKLKSEFSADQCAEYKDCIIDKLLMG